jgi:hypothetical protein
VKCPWCDVEIEAIAYNELEAIGDKWAVCYVCAMPVVVSEVSSFVARTVTLSRIRPHHLDELEAPALRWLLATIIKRRCGG